ncbi:MBOAT family O-acyltransferase [Fusobacterium sp. PH5-44]|uniref:MBOAT family O-acyltransferase n=1 Tax=unclassified Fusobacterium TaxID=2648384 RepID=UPI003D2176D4
MVKFKLYIPNFEILLPVGISFYTFQALSYTMDVYRRDVKAQKNFGKYALFVSFFPQLVAGPIERSTNLLYQFDEKIDFDYERIKDGLLSILWGLIKKVVIADRLAILVDTVYKEPRIYYGMPLLVASVFFSFQIYCDFSGYSDIAIGSAKIFGYDLMENFKRPYFSQSISEFWRRWHISLNTWFKDYLYIPLGGNKVGKLKNYRNIIIVFLISGLWHGAAWHYVVWGFGHGILQIIGKELQFVRDFFIKFFKVNRENFSHRLFKILFTFFIVNFMWVFFRANSLKDAIYVIKNMFKPNFWTFYDGTIYRLGLDKYDFTLSIKLINLLLITDFISEKINFKEFLKKQGLIFRWGVYFSGILIVLIFGCYGGEYLLSNFIYFQF